MAGSARLPCFVLLLSARSRAGMHDAADFVSGLCSVLRLMIMTGQPRGLRYDFTMSNVQ